MTQLAGEMFALLAVPHPSYKRPSHLVCGALAALLGQLGRRMGLSVDQLVARVAEVMPHIPEDQVRFFQEHKHLGASN